MTILSCAVFASGFLVGVCLAMALLAPLGEQREGKFHRDGCRCGTCRRN